MKTIILTLTLLFGLFSYADAPIKKSIPINPNYRVLTARLTRYNPSTEKGELPINHRGKKIVNKKGGCAVPKNTLSDGTKVYIPSLNKTFIVDDRIPKRSVKKHMRKYDCDIVIDLRYSKDCGVQEIIVYEN